MDHDKNISDAVSKVLGEPVSIQFPDNVWKIRTNLILTSLIAIAVVFGDLHIEADSTVMGLKFKGISDTVLSNGLVVIIAYLLVHFLWAAMDSFLEWRLRITGTRVAFVTTGRFSSEHCDYPSDPRQSTLYHWWLEQSKGLGSFTERMQQIDITLECWQSRMRSEFTESPDAMNIANATTSIGQVREQINRFHQAVTSAGKLIESPRIPESLARFDGWFEFFLRSQNLRWLVIEFLAPILAAAYALFLLVTK